MKAIVKHMNGGRTDGYYYIILTGTNFVLCEDGHPNFPDTYPETADGEKRAKNKARAINKSLNKKRIKLC